MGAKPFIASLSETFLSKVLARRDGEGQWWGGVLLSVKDEYVPRATLVETSGLHNVFGESCTPIEVRT